MPDIANIAIEVPGAELGLRLLPVARRIFSDTFSHLYANEPFERFLQAVYAPGGQMEQELASPEVEWRVAVLADEPVGYAKLTPLRAPFAEAARGSLELQQLYVAREWQGTGVAETLMTWALERARERDAPEIFLTVFDHNARAKRFYARHGFEEVGRCTFRLGERVNDDRIWRLRLAQPSPSHPPEQDGSSPALRKVAGSD